MKDKLKKLLEASGYEINWRDFDRASFVNNDNLINDLNQLFHDRFFDCVFESIEVESLNDLPEMFLISGDNPELVRQFGTDYLNSSNRVVTIEYLMGKTILFIHSRPKKIKPVVFIEQIFYLFPKVNLLIFLVVPFALIPAFYANIFNTRLIFNDVVYTLIFITLLFVSLWSIDYLIRYYVKVVNLKHFEKAAVKIENYLLSLLPFIRVPGLITKWRMIESGRKTIWDNLSGVLLDLLVFVFILLILFVLLGYFTFFLVLFYVSVFIVSVFIRYRNYKNFIESEKSNQDMLLEKLSIISSQNLFNFDKRGVRNHFNDKFKNSSRFDISVSTSNFYWEEFVRFSSFLASFILFVSVFYSVGMNVEIFSILIALLILNSRASAALVGLVNKLYFVVISTYHTFKSFSDMTDEINDYAFKKGVYLKKLDVLSVDKLTISTDKKTLIKDVSLRLHKGDIIGLFGKVGVGKSLLAKTLIQQHGEFRGSIVYNGNYSLESIDAQVFAKQVGYIDSKPFFMKGSLYYNFSIRGVRDKELVATLVNLIFPNASVDFDFLFQKDISTINMSTGQAAKLNLFMSLSMNKSLFILDEAFSNMPLVDVADFIRYIKTNFKSAMIVIISHDRNILNMLSDVYEVSNNALVSVKTSKEKVV
jgi:ABC-type bacteriocin/lantibiotic exporter with double-glycine peptidase domain